MHVKKLLIYCPYPLHEAPSQRFRFEQYLHLLEKQGFKITVLSFYNQKAWEVLYNECKQIEKSLYLILAIVKRFLSIRKALKAEHILIHRELLPVGPPLLEWIISRVFRKKIIYDFDDAIWITDNSNENWFVKALRWRSKVESICRWSFKISAGNEYLAEYARQFNTNVVVNPTTIDTLYMHNPDLHRESIASTKLSGEIMIGWTGSHSTLKYLESLEPVLQKIEDQCPGISFLVIADKLPQLRLKKIVFRTWTKETEIRDLALVDIGIMPLPDDEWVKGKCGFKALQYMAMGIPCIASSVGVNTTIIQHGKNGFLCARDEEWLACFHQLIINETLRKLIGRAGKQTVVDHYSVRSNTSTFLSLFE
jgi:glycosyltransferase involved in cell wall biosynthesis